jgi:hypothetical protein
MSRHVSSACCGDASRKIRDKWRSSAERHTRRALELEGTLAEAHEALAAVARPTEFDWERTIEQSVQALRLKCDPGPAAFLPGVRPSTHRPARSRRAGNRVGAGCQPAEPR